MIVLGQIYKYYDTVWLRYVLGSQGSVAMFVDVVKWFLQKYFTHSLSLFTCHVSRVTALEQFRFRLLHSRWHCWCWSSGRCCPRGRSCRWWGHVAGAPRPCIWSRSRPSSAWWVRPRQTGVHWAVLTVDSLVMEAWSWQSWISSDLVPLNLAPTFFHHLPVLIRLISFWRTLPWVCTWPPGPDTPRARSSCTACTSDPASCCPSWSGSRRRSWWCSCRCTQQTGGWSPGEEEVPPLLLESCLELRDSHSKIVRL